ncbi:hypothetical protein Poly30_55850 [Planctomycetes bacterium Poly30]|uniref:DUF1570 domain-containing protein n=1 Tax=Saltatorellus ferox TaxID=2528018 RepID=A0A518F120_9BACT|nr:hypothetical protein Poly30_55850 [Planctomycetes bacterium Poly30]
MLYLFASSLSIFLAAGALGGAAPASPPQDKLEIPEFELELDFSDLSKLEGGLQRSGQTRGQWTAEYDGTPISFSLAALLVSDGFDLEGPGEIAQIVGNSRGNARRAKGGSYDFQRSKPLIGDFGRVPYGWLAAHDTNTGTDIDGYDILVGGVTSAGAYFLDMHIKKRFTDKEWAAFEKWAGKAIHYTGEVIDPEWPEEEAEARWKKSMPESVEGNGNNQILRTDHYIIFTNVGKSTARAFGKQVDENYEKVRTVYPFEDLPGQKLLPIFYFLNKSQYIDWCVINLEWTKAQAELSAGVASGDAYATYQQSTIAPVHIHEQTHQIFRNRLHLSGGGSWFQEGVAEYISVQQSELNEVKQFAKQGTTQPLAELMTVPSLLMSAGDATRKKGGSVAGGAYTQAASLIEFVKHSKFGKDKFLEWIDAMGRVGRGDLPAIKRGITRIYGVTLEEFEAEYLDYWQNRKKVRDWHGPSK